MVLRDGLNGRRQEQADAVAAGMEAAGGGMTMLGYSVCRVWSFTRYLFKVHKCGSWASTRLIPPAELFTSKGTHSKGILGSVGRQCPPSLLNHACDARPLPNPFHSAGSLTSKVTTARDILGSLGRICPPQCAAAAAVLPASMPTMVQGGRAEKEGGVCQGMYTDTCVGERYSTRQEVRRLALLSLPLS